MVLGKINGDGMVGRMRIPTAVPNLPKIQYTLQVLNKVSNRSNRMNVCSRPGNTPPSPRLLDPFQYLRT
jgi:hypothetical protein